MFKKLSFYLISLLLFSSQITSCSNSDEEQNGNQGEQQDQRLKDLSVKAVKSALTHESSKISDEALKNNVKGQYNLNFELLKAADKDLNYNNAMISTFSIDSALAMAWAGAAGDTALEMANVLHYDNDTHSALNKISALVEAGRMPEVNNKDEQAAPVEINVTNDLYLSPKFTWKASWLDLLAKHYDAGITEMNFAADPEGARKYINDVVAADTKERIKDLLPNGSITGLTELVLTNAIYLKAPWAENFSIKGEKLSFTKADKTSVNVDAIYKSFARFAYAKTDSCQAVSVPLRGNHFNMLFILPNQDDIEDYMNNLNGIKMMEIIDSLGYSSSVNLTIPKFEFETKLSLGMTLQALGMKKAFGGADFSLMTDESNSFVISEVFHKTYIGVDEKGVEAAAATAVTLKESGIDPGTPVDLTINRPFMFVIYEQESKAPLFMGRVMDPSK